MELWTLTTRQKYWFKVYSPGARYDNTGDSFVLKRFWRIFAIMIDGFVLQIRFNNHLLDVIEINYI